MMKLPFSDVLPCGVCSFSSVDNLLDCRGKNRVPQGAKSVIMYLFPYYLGEEYYKDSNISKYAVPGDYHFIVGEYLKNAVKELSLLYPEYKFEAFCDNSPIPEVDTAVKCGLGVKGKNTLLINKEYGSFVFIGEIITDLELQPSLPEDRTCLMCGLCEKNCPGGALGGYKIRVSECLSHITQKKGELTEDEISLVSSCESVWGCDKCQDICPMNKSIKKTPVKEFYETARGRFEIGDYTKQRAYSWRPKSVIERNFKINCCK